jgi:hypothetical protein
MIRAFAAYTPMMAKNLAQVNDDPMLLYAAPLVLAVIAMLACCPPARRATKIDGLSGPGTHTSRPLLSAGQARYKDRFHERAAVGMTLVLLNIRIFAGRDDSAPFAPPRAGA